MKTVSEISKQTGVSVRTLHYYDATGAKSLISAPAFGAWSIWAAVANR